MRSSRENTNGTSQRYIAGYEEVAKETSKGRKLRSRLELLLIRAKWRRLR